MTLLILSHVLAGTLACLAGLVALVVRKGCKTHRFAGKVFIPSMLITGGGGAVYALDLPEALTAMVGVLCCYLILSGWHMVRRRTARSKIADLLSLSTALGLAFGFVALGVVATPSEAAPYISPEVFYAFAAITSAAAAADLANYWVNGLSARWRILQHLWRMGLTLFFAMGSLLDGPGTPIFPETLHGTLWLTAPVQLVAVATLYWFLITLFGFRFGQNKHQRAPSAVPGPTRL